MFQRYSSPMVLLNQMIRTGRLYEFITELVEIRNEELDEKASWEFWLHKDFERSFAEFRDDLINSAKAASTTKQDLVSIVSQSAEIASFVPPEED